ncbi:MAG: CpaF family protein [Alphaproteobacteria bacterium]|nr:CpaF family protein [Alphaproteobacteria bacterium]
MPEPAAPPPAAEPAPVEPVAAQQASVQPAAAEPVGLEPDPLESMTSGLAETAGADDLASFNGSANGETDGLESVPASGDAQGNVRLQTLHTACELARKTIKESDADLIALAQRGRSEFADKIESLAKEALANGQIQLSGLEHRAVITLLMQDLFSEARQQAEEQVQAQRLEEAQAASPTAATAEESPKVAANRSIITTAKRKLQPMIMDRIDVGAASALSRQELARELTGLTAELLVEEKMQLNQLEQRDLVTAIVNDMVGLGPLESVLADEAVTDILVNGPHQIYVERGGKLHLTDVQFQDDAHVMQVATRIVNAVGRRVDETTPLCDARLQDGSRVNVIIPPLAIDGPSISIRKFSDKKITLEVMARQGNVSQEMATVLSVAGRARINILISGGTGSGKTTTLNAVSQMIDPQERIVTIEDAAELKLQQPHVVRLETRSANLEGQGEISMRDLVKNSLRMRPDRIILGEVRGAEAVDMLQAMNTGHDGSFSTIHANNPREALTRLENMVGMAGINLPARAVRTQIVSAINMIVQVSRMRDGKRRITHISEIVGMEGDVVLMQDLFTYEFQGENEDGSLRGEFKSSRLRPHFLPQAEYFGLGKTLLGAIG